MGLFNNKLAQRTKGLNILTPSLKLKGTNILLNEGKTNLLHTGTIVSSNNYNIIKENSSSTKQLDSHIPKISLTKSDYSGASMSLTDASIENVKIINGLQVCAYLTVDSIEEKAYSTVYYDTIYIEFSKGFIAFKKQGSKLTINYISSVPVIINKVTYEPSDILNVDNIQLTKEINISSLPFNPEATLNLPRLSHVPVETERRSVTAPENLYFTGYTTEDFPYLSKTGDYFVTLAELYEEPLSLLDYLQTNYPSLVTSFEAGNEISLTIDNFRDLDLESTSLQISGVSISVSWGSTTKLNLKKITSSNIIYLYFAKYMGETDFSLSYTYNSKPLAKKFLYSTKDFITYKRVITGDIMTDASFNTALDSLQRSYGISYKIVNNNIIYKSCFSEDGGNTWKELSNYYENLTLTSASGTRKNRQISITGDDDIEYTNGVYWCVQNSDDNIIFAYTTNLNKDWKFFVLDNIKVQISSTAYSVHVMEYPRLVYVNGTWILYNTAPSNRSGGSGTSSGITTYNRIGSKYMYISTNLSSGFTTINMTQECNWSDIVTTPNHDVLIRYVLNGSDDSNYGPLTDNIEMAATIYSLDYGKTWTYRASSFGSYSNNHDNCSLIWCEEGNCWFWEGGNNSQYHYMLTRNPASWNINNWESANMPYTIHGYYRIYGHTYCITQGALYHMTSKTTYDTIKTYTLEDGYSDPYPVLLTNGDYFMHTYDSSSNSIYLLDYNNPGGGSNLTNKLTKGTKIGDLYRPFRGLTAEIASGYYAFTTFNSLEDYKNRVNITIKPIL